MKKYIYIADFGELIKVGVSNNPWKRLATFSSLEGIQFKSMSVRRFYDETFGSMAMERFFKVALKDYLHPTDHCDTETFKFSYSVAVNALNNIEFKDPREYVPSALLPSDEIQKWTDDHPSDFDDLLKLLGISDAWEKK